LLLRDHSVEGYPFLIQSRDAGDDLHADENDRDHDGGYGRDRDAHDRGCDYGHGRDDVRVHENAHENENALLLNR